MRLPSDPIPVPVDQTGGSEHARELLIIAVDVAYGDDALDAGPDAAIGAVRPLWRPEVPEAWQERFPAVGRRGDVLGLRSGEAASGIADRRLLRSCGGCFNLRRSAIWGAGAADAGGAFCALRGGTQRWGRRNGRYRSFL